MAEWFSKTDQVPLAAATGSAIMLGLFLLGSFLHTRHPQAFELLSQEDDVLEWTTFWTFIGAAAAFGLTALRQRAAGIRLPWFAWGLAAFCLFVAGEEISWDSASLVICHRNIFWQRIISRNLTCTISAQSNSEPLFLKSFCSATGWCCRWQVWPHKYAVFAHDYIS